MVVVHQLRFSKMIVLDLLILKNVGEHRFQMKELGSLL